MNDYKNNIPSTSVDKVINFIKNNPGEAYVLYSALTPEKTQEHIRDAIFKIIGVAIISCMIVIVVAPFFAPYFFEQWYTLATFGRYKVPNATDSDIKKAKDLYFTAKLILWVMSIGMLFLIFGTYFGIGSESGSSMSDFPNAVDAVLNMK